MSTTTNDPEDPAGEPGKPRSVKGTDLASLFGPIKIEADKLGTISLPLRTTGFLVWYEKGKKADRWNGDSEVFIRDMLAEQATTGEEKEPLRPELLGTLDAGQIDQIAALIVTQIGDPLVRVKRSGDEASVKPAVATRPVVGPSPAAKLLTIVDQYYEHYRTAAKRMTEQFLKNDSLSTIKQALAQTSAFQIESDRLRATIESATAANRFLAERPLFAQLEMRGVSAFLEQQDLVAKSIKDIISPLHKLGPTISLAERFKPVIDRSLHEEIVGSRLAWAKTVATGFHLRTASVASMSATATAAQTVAKFMADTRFDRLGFQTTANLALDGLVGRGAAADILNRYDEVRTLHGAIFDEVLAAVRSLDNDKAPGDPIAAAESAWHSIATKRSSKLSHEQVMAWIAIASLLLDVVCALIAYEALHEQRRSDSSARIERMQSEMSAWHAESKAAREADKDAARFIRYVHDTAILRTDPDRTGTIIRLVYPDQMLRVIEAKGSWVFVEAFDYGTDKPLRGWIARRNLRIAPAR